MRKMRKGFTLIELLIVIMVMGSLSAALVVATGNATSRAKAQSIVANVDACKTAAALYYADHWEETQMGTVKSEAFLSSTDPNSGDKYVPNFADFSTGNITFTAGSGEGHDNWNITVAFTKDSEAANVQAQLAKIRGYSAVVSGTTSFTVNLTTGKVTVE
ncbi:MAG: type II secretion system protein [Synergistaceae bacterium]|nr:type II secretion system protein [Synergistaceae bacterium]